jgi:hypothetical protein
VPRPLFIGYTLAMAVVCAISVALAVQAYGTTRHADQWQRDARVWQQRATGAAARDQKLVAKYGALKGMYDDLVGQVRTSETQLAAEIARTRAMRPKVVTGAAIVSYVTKPAGG